MASLKLKHCLFCGSESSPMPVPRLNIPGAGRSVLLNGQLENVFVLRILLEMDPRFLAKLLPGGGREQQPGQWFSLCEGCRECEVKPAWAAYQRMMQEQAKIREVGRRVKQEMEDTVKRKGTDRGKGVEAQIKRQLFPYLFGGSAEKPSKPQEKPSFKVEVCEDGPTSPGFLEDPQDTDRTPPEEKSPPSPEYILPVPAPTRKITKNVIQKKLLKSSSSSTSLSRAVKRVRQRNRKRKPRPIDQLKRFKCFDCGCYFETHDSLLLHQEAHQRSRESGGGPFDCAQCTFPAASQDELQRHMKTRHRVRHYSCSKCPFREKTWKELADHIIAEHPDIEETERDELCLRCSVCQRRFVDRQHWCLHRRKMHPELFDAAVDSPVDCQECGERFLSQIKLKYHIKSAHRRPSKYVCDVCGMGFQFPAKLENHKVVHTRQFKRDYICHVCGIDYAHVQQLMAHNRKFHSEEPGKSEHPQEEFKCRYCDLTSPFKVVISRHLKTHKEENGYKCEECGNSYINRQGLARHKRMNHPMEKTVVPCPYCRKLFPNLDYMKTHIKNWCKLKGVAEAATIEQQEESSSSAAILFTSGNLYEAADETSYKMEFM